MTRATEACVRLARTRGQLRLAIRTELGPVRPVPASPAAGWMERLWGRLRSRPATAAFVHGVDEWAAHSPVPLAARLAVDALNTTVRPLAQRNPLLLVGAACVMGGTLAWSRPWRRIVTPALLASVLPQLVAAMFGGVPRHSLLRLAASLLQRRRSANVP